MRLSLIVCVAAAVGLCGAAEGRPPNVVILYADDMGIGDVGCYGCNDIRTPNIDALAKSGVRFSNYYSAAPVCSPSRAALLTGRYPIRAGVPTNCPSQPGSAGMPAGEVTLAELAKTRGYATALIGKWHLGFSDETRPNAQGFDYFFGHHCGCIDYYSHMFYWQEPHHHDLYRNRDEIHEEGQYMTDLIAREATRFIDEHRASPFLLYVAFNAPHYPMQAPERFRRMYENLPPQRAIYAAMVACMDDAIGRILERLRRNGLERDTLVFFASDNGATTEARGNYGGGSNAPYRGHKFSVFEGGIRMPGIVAWPGTLPAGQVREQLVCAIDVWPTVAEIIDAAVLADRITDGMSWIPLLKNPAVPGHDALFWMQGGQRAVRRGKWKLVLDGNDFDPAPKQAIPRAGRRGAGRETPEAVSCTLPATRDPAVPVFLADLEADPGETRNLCERHPQVVDELTRRHDRWRIEVTGTRSGTPAR